MDLGRQCAIHFIGIGGSGMCGIAEVMHNQGHKITGSELSASTTTARLEELGVKIFYGHAPAHVGDVDVVVVSSAVSDDNIEITTAHQKGVPVIPRAKALAELMRFRYGIAVAGTHGKTTTTSLISNLLADAGHDPTFVIGGRLNHANSHARLGKSRYMVTEADESDKSFLFLRPIMAVLTNIDSDHLENYSGDYQSLIDTFISFMQEVPFFGLAVVCIDNETNKMILPHLNCPRITYGFANEADLRASDYRVVDDMSHFTLHHAGKSYPMALQLPGRHNVQNALAAIAIALSLDVSLDTIQLTLKHFKGVARRFQRYGKQPLAEGEVHMVDDYGHHPREIEANITAVRDLWPMQRLVMLFQPHRYSRNRSLWQDFLKVLPKVDKLLLLDTFAAGEASVDNACSASMAKALSAKGHDVVHLSGHVDVKEVCRWLKAGDVVVTQGAGDIGLFAPKLVEFLQSQLTCVKLPA